MNSFLQMSKGMSLTSRPFADSAHSPHFLAVFFWIPKAWMRTDTLVHSSLPCQATAGLGNHAYTQSKVLSKTFFREQLTTIQLGLVHKAKCVRDPRQKRFIRSSLGRNRLLGYHRRSLGGNGILDVLDMGSCHLGTLDTDGQVCWP